jgi:hypothetical protein
MSNAYIAMAATSVTIEDDSRCPVLYSDSGASETIINDIRLGRNFRRLDKPRRFAGAVNNGIKSYLTAYYECEVLSFGLGLYSEEAAVNLLSDRGNSPTTRMVHPNVRRRGSPPHRPSRPSLQDSQEQRQRLYPLVVPPADLTPCDELEEPLPCPLPGTAALALVNGTFMTRKELAACDEIEALHLRFNHVN